MRKGRLMGKLWSTGAVNTFETLFQEGLIGPEDCTDKLGEN
jgi:hypothetical protein